MDVVRRLSKNEIFILACILLLSLPILIPLFHSGFLVTDDGDLMLIRFTAFHQELLHLQFPVRFLTRLNFQYGYPVVDFLYPGFLYIAEAIHLLHFGFINSIKILLALSLLGSSFFTYLWLRKSFSAFSSSIGALLYLYAPYHFYDLYKRGSVGEILALVVLPFIFWAIEKKLLSLVVLGISLLILSHNTLAALLLPLIVLYYGIRWKVWENKKKFFSSLGLLFLSLLTASFFWIPALYDLRYTIFSQTKVSDIADYFFHPDTALFHTISLFYLGLIITGFLLYRKYRPQRETTLSYIGILFLLCSSITLLLNTTGSFILWKSFPISFIQFPFRLFSITMISLAWMIPLFLDSQRQKVKPLIGIFLLILFSLPTYFFLPKIQYTTKDDMYYATNEDTTTVRNEYLPRWVKERSYTRPLELVEGKNITYLGNSGGLYKIAVAGDEARKIRVNMVYFPGWEAYGNGEKLSLSYQNRYGLMDISLPAHTHEVTLRFTETPVRLASDVVSLLSFGVLFVLMLKDVQLLYALRKK